jgi:hypothetical protein
MDCPGAASGMSPLWDFSDYCSWMTVVQCCCQGVQRRGTKETLTVLNGLALRYTHILLIK